MMLSGESDPADGEPGSDGAAAARCGGLPYPPSRVRPRRFSLVAAIAASVPTRPAANGGGRRRRQNQGFIINGGGGTRRP